MPIPKTLEVLTFSPGWEMPFNKAATLNEIEAQGWLLNPGRYVGIAAGPSAPTPLSPGWKRRVEKMCIIVAG